MRTITVHGSTGPLRGTPSIAGSKNAAMPLLAAAALSRRQVWLRRVPRIADLAGLTSALAAFGDEIRREGPDLLITPGAIVRDEIPANVSAALRGSLYALVVPAVVLGRARCGPIGGDSLSRTMAPHARAFAGFGMDLRPCGAGWEVTGGPPRPSDFVLGDRGNTATGIAILLAACCDGESIIREASSEPENDDLLDFVRAAGARARREGRTLLIGGPMSGGAIDFTVPPDRLHAATLLIATLLTGGTITLPMELGARLGQVLDIFEAAGAVVERSIALTVRGTLSRPIRVATEMYPGYATDLLPQTLTLMTQIPGTSVAVENVYAHRFGHSAGLAALGARVAVEGNRAVVHGGRRLNGCTVDGGGIRETAALVLAGLVARGRTVIRHADALARGYENLCNDLRLLGAAVEEVNN